MIPTMKRYVIEREIPGVGAMSHEQLQQTAITSCEAAAKLYGKIQWEHSYIARDKTFCIYLADGEASILEMLDWPVFRRTKLLKPLSSSIR